MRITLSNIVWTAARAATLAGLPGTAAEANSTSDLSLQLQASIKGSRLMDNLKNLESIATFNGGNRALGSPGYNASRNWIISKISKSSTWKAWAPDFTAYYYSEDTDRVEHRITQNVFAESNGGDPRNVIMLGAHLDSVEEGAGIDDNGSGTSLLLEIFDGLQQLSLRNKIRIAWWGAEEEGLVGSEFYTDSINNTREADDLLAYLNFDMVGGASLGVYNGYNNTPGSGTIQALFVDYFESQGKKPSIVDSLENSDGAYFNDTLKKPVGGLFTGLEDCYHKACDNIDNVDEGMITLNTKAAAHVLVYLAMEGQSLIAKGPRTAPRNVTAEV